MTFPPVNLLKLFHSLAFGKMIDQSMKKHNSSGNSWFMTLNSHNRNPRISTNTVHNLQLKEHIFCFKTLKLLCQRQAIMFYFSTEEVTLLILD